MWKVFNNSLQFNEPMQRDTGVPNIVVWYSAMNTHGGRIKLSLCIMYRGLFQYPPMDDRPSYLPIYPGIFFCFDTSRTDTKIAENILKFTREYIQRYRSESILLGIDTEISSLVHTVSPPLQHASHCHRLSEPYTNLGLQLCEHFSNQLMIHLVG